MWWIRRIAASFHWPMWVELISSTDCIFLSLSWAFLAQCQIRQRIEEGAGSLGGRWPEVESGGCSRPRKPYPPPSSRTGRRPRRGRSAGAWSPPWTSPRRKPTLCWGRPSGGSTLLTGEKREKVSSPATKPSVRRWPTSEIWASPTTTFASCWRSFPKFWGAVWMRRWKSTSACWRAAGGSKGRPWRSCSWGTPRSWAITWTAKGTASRSAPAAGPGSSRLPFDLTQQVNHLTWGRSTHTDSDSHLKDFFFCVPHMPVRWIQCTWARIFLF